jgi:tetratricopeptide (TPR) repeat protein
VLVGAGDTISVAFDSFELYELPLAPDSVDPSRAQALGLVDIGAQQARAGDIESSMESFTQAQNLDPELEISAQAWNQLCWYGSLWGYAEDVLEACETAVVLEPEDGNIRDSRGLARALTGDVEGAIEDFQFFIEWAPGHGHEVEAILRRENWISDMQAGIDPFTPEMLEMLKGE